MKYDYVVTVHSDPHQDRQYTRCGTQRLHCKVTVHTPQLLKIIQGVKRADLAFRPYAPTMQQEARQKNVLHFVLTATLSAGDQDGRELLQFLRALGWKFAEQLALYLSQKQIPTIQRLEYQGDLDW